MKVVLTIDTRNNKEMVVGLTIDGKEDIRRQPLDTRKAQVVLPLVKTLLQQHTLKLEDVTAIEVATGPGSFTGIRVGITIAKTLGSLLHIPVNGTTDFAEVKAQYT